MKNMRRSLYGVGILLILLFMIVSCKKQSTPVSPEALSDLQSGMDSLSIESKLGDPVAKTTDLATVKNFVTRWVNDLTTRVKHHQDEEELTIMQEDLEILEEIQQELMSNMESVTMYRYSIDSEEEVSASTFLILVNNQLRYMGFASE